MILNLKFIFDRITCLHPVQLFYPWRCLKRGFFLLITYNLPLRRTILQSTLRFLMAARTFMFAYLLKMDDKNTSSINASYLYR